MSKLPEECLYTPNKIENGVVINEQEDFVKSGYVRYWGQSTSVSYTLVGDVPVPIVMNVIVCAVQDKETGKIYICNAEQIQIKT